MIRRASVRPDDEPRALGKGVRVVVRDRFHGCWAAGFEIEEATRTGYRIRRRADGYVLPAEFPAADVRPI